MIKRLLIVFILILLLIGLPTLAITDKEKQGLFIEAKVLCSMFAKQCKVVEETNKSMYAQTGIDNVISISSALLDRMNQKQVRSVLYHEVGHVVYGHVEKNFEYIMECSAEGTCNNPIYHEMRRNAELQADRFAIYVLKYTRQEEGLIEALLILTPKDMINTTHSTHPSTADRIKQIERLYYGK